MKDLKLRHPPNLEVHLLTAQDCLRYNFDFPEPRQDEQDEEIINDLPEIMEVSSE